jgi:hypothetical protein
MRVLKHTIYFGFFITGDLGEGEKKDDDDDGKKNCILTTVHHTQHTTTLLLINNIALLCLISKEECSDGRLRPSLQNS